MRVLVVAIVALLCTGCPGERSPFCSRWLGLDDREREGEIREQVKEWRERVPTRGPVYAEFLGCIAGYVVDRRAAVDSACRNFGDLEAGLTIGRLITAGAEACAELPRVPVP